MLEKNIDILNFNQTEYSDTSFETVDWYFKMHSHFYLMHKIPISIDQSKIQQCDYKRSNGRKKYGCY